jgi:hypothetical protein
MGSPGLGDPIALNEVQREERTTVLTELEFTGRAVAEVTEATAQIVPRLAETVVVIWTVCDAPGASLPVTTTSLPWTVVDSEVPL